MNTCRVRILSAVLISAAPAVAVLADEPFSDQPAQQTQASNPVPPEPDTWITTKVEARLITSKDIPADGISVSTNAGIVTLTGSVDTQAQLDRSIAVVKAVKGVRDVISSALSARQR